MLIQSLRLHLTNIDINVKRILNFSKENSGYLTFKTITQNVHCKYEELYTKFGRLIDIAKSKIMSDIMRNKSK
jgi:hypothetical protein